MYNISPRTQCTLCVITARSRQNKRKKRKKAARESLITACGCDTFTRYIVVVGGGGGGDQSTHTHKLCAKIKKVVLKNKKKNMYSATDSLAWWSHARVYMSRVPLALYIFWRVCGVVRVSLSLYIDQLIARWILSASHGSFRGIQPAPRRRRRRVAWAQCSSPPKIYCAHARAMLTSTPLIFRHPFFCSYGCICLTVSFVFF